VAWWLANQVIDNEKLRDCKYILNELDYCIRILTFNEKCHLLKKLNRKYPPRKHF
jgi:hypothetical protein